MDHYFTLLFLLFGVEQQSTNVGPFQLQIENGTLMGVQPLSIEYKFLNLSQLELTGISPDAFDNVTHLTSLEISDDDIKHLPETLFSKLTNLEKLKISIKQFIDITSHFSSLKKLKLLDASESFFDYKANAFAGLQDDCELKLNGEIYMEPKLFGINESSQVGNRNLSKFNCFNDYPDSFTKLKKLEKNVIDVYFRRSKDHEEVANFSISDGVVERVTFGQRENSEPILLNLYQKGIKGFKKDWYQISHEFTSHIYFAVNEIEEIDENLLNDLPKNVAIVWLNVNKLKIIKNNVIINNNIQQFELGSNAIEIVEANAFREMKSLLILNLRNNKISNLDFIASISNTLVHLNLEENNISSIPDNIFSHLNNLYYLELYRNKIKMITDKTFIGLRKLNFLGLQRNEIERIGRDNFDELRCLQELGLGQNKITTLEKGFAKNLNNMHELKLGESVNVTKLERGIFYGLPADSAVVTTVDPNSFEVGVFRKY